MPFLNSRNDKYFPKAANILIMPFTFHHLKQKLAKKHQELRNRLQQKHPQTHKLLKKKGLEPGRLRLHAAKLLAGATVASTLLTQPAALAMLPGKTVIDQAAKSVLPAPAFIDKEVEERREVVERLRAILPSDKGQLNPWEIGEIDKLLGEKFKVHADAELTDHRLHHQYGWMGMEQHLRRFPGDSLKQHEEMKEVGMAPRLGAWGYFANSKAELTDKDVLREKYYVAVQTLYLPGWNESLPEIKEWYKYRKVIVVNPENGKAVVAVIGDAGPARSTGKQFGGSPEVMKLLDLHEGMRSGKVVLLFADDPEDKIPLGPL